VDQFNLWLLDWSQTGEKKKYLLARNMTLGQKPEKTGKQSRLWLW